MRPQAVVQNQAGNAAIVLSTTDVGASSVALVSSPDAQAIPYAEGGVQTRASGAVAYARRLILAHLGASTPADADRADAELRRYASMAIHALWRVCADPDEPVDIRAVAARVVAEASLSSKPFSAPYPGLCGRFGPLQPRSVLAVPSRAWSFGSSPISFYVAMLSRDSRALVRLGALEGAIAARALGWIVRFLSDAHPAVRTRAEQSYSLVGAIAASGR